ncbi:MAG TPA: MarR family EPS-associated transcriptional regulator [Candidatus Omnitrophica bacterium]|nr:MarR family EPS-associated transcriptional regulator [Candidatus Omnitrophota bacterium]
MIEHTPREEVLSIIRHLEDDPSTTQRALSNRLNISLGKTNYLLKELVKKGFVKAQSFSHNSGKLQKVNYLLTKEGFEERLRLTGYFLKTKEEEYNRMKKEWEQLTNRPTQYSSSEAPPFVNKERDSEEMFLRKMLDKRSL